MRKIIPILFSILALRANAQQNKALSDTLARMVVADQKAAGLPPPEIDFNSPAWQKMKDSTYTSHYERLKALFPKTGYPGYDQVGKEGSKQFWLLVQHLDKWPDFQQKVLDAMEKEVAKNNASPTDFAYLTDRVRLNTGKKQVYGTQVTYNLETCQAVPRPLENPETVNERRKKMGMDVLEKYLNTNSEIHFQMNKASYEQKGITGPKIIPVPAN